jgi:hypothetical protein
MVGISVYGWVTLPLALLVIFFTQYFAVMAAIRKAGRND